MKGLFSLYIKAGYYWILSSVTVKINVEPIGTGPLPYVPYPKAAGMIISTVSSK